MSDSASNLARDAKGLHQTLKELLKTLSPCDKEVEIGRKNLRRQYLRLLLLEPYAKHSKDAETHLWMQTSYQFISHYKQTLSNLERTLQSAPRHQQRQAGHGPVEYRKLIQRFRQFLSDEEKFWTQFIVRYQRSFALHQAHPVLLALNILTPSDDANLPSLPDPAAKNHSSHHQHHGRNQHFFPPEECSPEPDPAQHESRLAILSKAIVCLGDIARYRELYNEAGGRPKAGHEDGTAPARRGGRASRGGIPGFDSIPRARNYDKAIQCYEQARFLVPYEGNPSHQLAILAFYQGDMFNSLFHYYRALCVRQPYDTASENVKKILNKALDQQSKKNKDKDASTTTPDPGDVPPRLRVEYFKENVVLLHALWRLGSDKIKMNPVTHAEDLAKDFHSLVSERILPIEMVSKVVVLSQGALWKHRMIRASPVNRRSSTHVDPSAVESQIASHLIAIHRVLVEMAAAELAVEPEDAAENDLAQRITAPFRRTLPALRIASKWLVANMHYVVHAAQQVAEQGTGKGTRGLVIEGVPLFWAKLAQFYSALGDVFPVQRLPALRTPLDEDVDLKGFLPLRDLLVDGVGTDSDAVGGTERGAERNGTGSHAPVREKVHPNEEQLMRIWDLLNDARMLAGMEGCPLRLDGQAFTVDGSRGIAVTSADTHEPFHIPDQQHQPLTLGEYEQEEDVMTDTGWTDDDPVGAAFRVALDGHGAGDEEEVIVYNPRPLGSPPSAASAALSLPTTPILVRSTIKADEVSTVTKTQGPGPGMGAHANTSSPGRTITGLGTVPVSKSSAIVPRTTAQDLLNNVIGSKRSGTTMGDVSGSVVRQTIRPPTSLPFGLVSSAPSIWSTTLDQGTIGTGTGFHGHGVGLNPSWSPQQPLGQPSGRFPSSQPQGFSGIEVGAGHPNQSPGYRPSTMGMGMDVSQPQTIFQTSAFNASSGIIPGQSQGQVMEHLQAQAPWLNAAATTYGGPPTDPAVVSISSVSPVPPRHGPFQAFSNGHAQQQLPGQRSHQRSPSTSRSWGIHG